MLAGTALALLLLFATGAHAAPGQTAVASSGNFSAQNANQHQDTKTIAVPITALSGNAVSVFGHGNTTANNFSGVVVAPTQSSTQRSSQVSHASAKNTSKHATHEYDKHPQRPSNKCSRKDGYGKGATARVALTEEGFSQMSSSLPPARCLVGIAQYERDDLPQDVQREAAPHSCPGARA
jgi:hypothetical protein